MVLDLQTASIESLISLPGVGIARAKKIKTIQTRGLVTLTSIVSSVGLTVDAVVGWIEKGLVKPLPDSPGKQKTAVPVPRVAEIPKMAEAEGGTAENMGLDRTDVEEDSQINKEDRGENEGNDSSHSSNSGDDRDEDADRQSQTSQSGVQLQEAQMQGSQIVQLLEQVLEKLGTHHKLFDAIREKFASQDYRFARFEDHFVTKFASQDDRFARFEDHFDTKFASQEDRLARMTNQMNDRLDGMTRSLLNLSGTVADLEEAQKKLSEGEAQKNLFMGNSSNSGQDKPEKKTIAKTAEAGGDPGSTLPGFYGAKPNIRQDYNTMPRGFDMRSKVRSVDVQDPYWSNPSNVYLSDNVNEGARSRTPAGQDSRRHFEEASQATSKSLNAKEVPLDSNEVIHDDNKGSSTTRKKHSSKSSKKTKHYSSSSDDYDYTSEDSNTSDSNDDSGRSRDRSNGFGMPKMQTFSGESKEWNAFLFQFKQYCRANKLSTKDKRASLLRCLRGKATDYIRNRPKYVVNDYKELVRDLNKRYGKADPASAIRKELQTITQADDQTLEEFADHVYDLTLEGYPKSPDEMVQTLAVDAFLKGCKDKHASLMAMEKSPKTVQKAVKYVKTSIQNRKSLSDEWSVWRVTTDQVVPNLQSTCLPDKGTDVLAECKQLLNNLLKMLVSCPLLQAWEKPKSGAATGAQCYKCGKVGHLSKDCRGGGARTWTASPGNKRCYRCGQEGHIARVCRHRRTHQFNNRSPRTQNGRCQICGREGHIARDCRERMTQKHSFNSRSSSPRTRDNSCRICGEEGHFARECRQNRSNSSNRKSILKQNPTRDHSEGSRSNSS